MGVPGFLNREYERRKRRNARYSLRAFARDLGCDHSTLSQWMRGKRPITEEAAGLICQALGLHGVDRRRVCELDEIDLQVVAAARETEARNCHDLSAASGLGIDRLNISLSKLMRLGVLRMAGSEWHLVEKELA
jgi:transcriptional regulator with XRE-family HTH domain